MRATLLPLLMTGLVIAVVFLPPSVGLASNGDFEKVSRCYNLVETASDQFHYATLYYAIDPAKHWASGFVSSEHLPAWVAVQLQRLSGSPRFDIRWIGLVHAAVFLLAIAIASPRLNGWLSAATLIILGDVANLAYFNTFYMDAAGLVFLLLAIAAYLRQWPWLVTIATVLFVLAKPQHAVLGLPAVAFFLTRRQWTTALLVLAALTYSLRSVPADYAPPAVFNMIFYQILPASANPSQDLRELGLGHEFLRYRGMYSFSEGAPIHDPDFNRAFRKRTSHGRLAIYYLRHPQTAVTILLRQISEAGQIRPPMGNYDRSADKPPSAMSYSFALWSSLKRTLFNGRGYLLLTATVLLSWFGRRQWTLVLTLWLAAITGCLADCLEVTRHLYVFHLLFDLLVLAILRERFRSPSDLALKMGGGKTVQLSGYYLKA